MQFKILIAFTTSFSFLITSAQNTFISGSINSNELEFIEIVKLGVNGHLQQNVVVKLPVNAHQFSGSFAVQEKGMYRIGDGWAGHQVFLTPGDTVQLGLEKIKPRKDQKGSTITPTFHRMHVKGTYPKHYTFFDEVNQFFGQSVYSFKKNYFNAKKFKISCDSAYNAALARLNDYHIKKLVSDTFTYYAKGELDARYVLWLCTPLTYFEKATMPPEYFDNISGVSFNDFKLLTGTDSYVTAASVYNMYILNDFDPRKWYSNLDNEFHTASTHFNGILRDRLMGWVLTDYKDKEFQTFDSLYAYFLNECKSPRIKNEVQRSVEAYRLSEMNKPSFASLLDSTIVTNLNDQSFRLADIPGSKRWILFDCWASWCVPCKKQLPFLKKFEKKYTDSIQFIYLSLDEKKVAWEGFIAKNKYKTEGQYLVNGAFKSSFARYFNLLTIPRYILIDRINKRVINKDLPMPIQQEGFEASLMEVLNDYRNRQTNTI